MTALDKSRVAPTLASFPPQDFYIPLTEDAVVFQGGLVCVDTADDNLGTAGATSTTLIAVGIAQEDKDNTDGADSALSVHVRAGSARFENSAAADEIDATHLFQVVYMVDDQTAAATDGTGTRSPLGVLVGFDGTRPIVYVSPFTGTLIAHTAAAIAVATA